MYIFHSNNISTCLSASFCEVLIEVVERTEEGMITYGACPQAIDNLDSGCQIKHKMTS